MGEAGRQAVKGKQVEEDIQGVVVDDDAVWLCTVGVAMCEGDDSWLQNGILIYKY